jgi:hypothetical protein
MASNKAIRFGPVYFPNGVGSIANLINTAITSLAGPVGYTQTQPYVVIRHIRVVNNSVSAATFSLYIGTNATAHAAGTEVVGIGFSVAANAAFDWYGLLRLDSTDFLNGFANAATTLTFEAEGEIGIS